MGRAGQREEVPSRHLWPSPRAYTVRLSTTVNVSPGPTVPCCLLPGRQHPRGLGPGPAASTVEQAWARGPVRPPDRAPPPPLIKPPGRERLCTRGHAASTLCEGEMEEGGGGEAALRSLWSHQLPHAHEQEHTLTPAAAASAFRHLHLHLLDTLPESPLGGGD